MASAKAKQSRRQFDDKQNLGLGTEPALKMTAL